VEAGGLPVETATDVASSDPLLPDSDAGGWVGSSVTLSP